MPILWTYAIRREELASEQVARRARGQRIVMEMRPLRRIGKDSLVPIPKAFGKSAWPQSINL